ncbi:MAG: hypothetical protein M3Z23_06090 [Acidobacteriota bacterium]|nr:hypothetical protein [Acidobacteriota bacterium]
MAPIETLSSNLIEDFHTLNQRGIEKSARLVECELDARLTALEDRLSRQTRYLQSVRDLAVHTGAAISRITAEVERLFEKVANTAPTAVSAMSLALVPVTRLPEIESPRQEITWDAPHRTVAAQREIKAMFAFVDVEDSGVAYQEEPISRVECSRCLSPHTRRSRRRAWIDACLRLFSIHPWRCRDCGARFYRYDRARRHNRKTSPIEM